MYYHYIVTLWKTVRNGKITYFDDKISRNVPGMSSSRVLCDGKLGVTLHSHKSIVNCAWRWKCVNNWNNLPPDLRNETKLDTFKRKLKVWTKLKIEL